MLRFTTASILAIGLAVVTAAQPVVIAHRGASGYLPEHTLAAAAYAHALGADYIEQDIVMSRDNTLVVLHDIHLEMTTDVATVFPNRAREDGRFYAIDFDWNELQRLRVNERINSQTGQRIYPERFPALPGPFKLCSLEQQITLIQGLNNSTGRNIGIYPEIKFPRWHADEGKDLSAALLQVLQRTGYTRPGAKIFVQCFDVTELKRLRREFKTELPLIQLIGLNSWNHADVNYESMLTPDALGEIATYAQGIGPHLDQILVEMPPDQKPALTSLVADAHRVGLLVHPYTLRADALPPGIKSIEELRKIMVDLAQVDGLFTDHPDRVGPPPSS